MAAPTRTQAEVPAPSIRADRWRPSDAAAERQAPVQVSHLPGRWGVLTPLWRLEIKRWHQIALPSPSSDSLGRRASTRGWLPGAKAVSLLRGENGRDYPALFPEAAPGPECLLTSVCLHASKQSSAGLLIPGFSSALRDRVRGGPVDRHHRDRDPANRSALSNSSKRRGTQHLIPVLRSRVFFNFALAISAHQTRPKR